MSVKMKRWEPFDKYPDEYDQWFYRNKITADNEVKLLKTFYIGSPSLEVGVGSGYFAYRLGIEIGLDPSYNILIKSQRRNIDSILGLGEKMPFRDNVFKTVLLIVTLCFLDNPVDTLREIYRVLTSDGNLITCIVPRDSSWGRYYTRLSREGHRFYRYARFYSLDELTNLLETTGFERGRSVGTLSYSPFEDPYIEEPSENIFNKGFVCIENYKYS
jgi:ubiquinone/menaquinone biosynthesis C-methylase UbiE